MRVLFIFLFLAFSFVGLAHEGHHEKSLTASEKVQDPVQESVNEGRPTTWFQWVGTFHLLFLHFPIALINMLAVSEILLIWSKKQIFEFSSQFLVIAAAILSPPTALLGLIHSYSAPYGGLMETFLWWHMWLGILTAITAVAVAILRERNGVSNLYYSGLLLLFILVNSAGFFGGGMTFGPYHMNLPL